MSLRLLWWRINHLLSARVNLIAGAYGIIYVLFIFSNYPAVSIFATVINRFSYCVGTRRRVILDRNQIDKCSEILISDHATNFETRMVAEVNLYWIIYESCSAVQVDLPKTQAALHEWRQEWKFLFGKHLSLALYRLPD